jgi:hypothetical protein
MKRAYAMVLLAILAINSAGFYVYYIVALQKIHAEAKAQLKYLPEESLQLLKLTAEEFKAALVDDHEVKVNGKMYDIARVTEQSGYVFVYCIHDEAEDNLVAFIEKVLTVPLKGKSSIPTTVSHFLSLIFVLPMHSVSFSHGSTSAQPATAYSFSNSTQALQIQVPPPRV